MRRFRTLSACLMLLVLAAPATAAPESAPAGSDWQAELARFAAIEDAGRKSDEMLAAARQLIDSKEVARAYVLAEMIPGKGAQAQIFALIAEQYLALEYRLRVTEALERADTALDEEKNRTDASRAAASLVKIYARMREFKRGDAALGKINDAQLLAEAHAALSEAFANAGKLEEAEDHLDDADDAAKTIYDQARLAFVRALAKADKPGEARSWLKDATPGNETDTSRLTVIESFARQREFDDAREVAEAMTTPLGKAQSHAALGAGMMRSSSKEEGGQALKEALAATETLEDNDSRSKARGYLAEQYASLSAVKEARELLAKDIQPKDKEKAVLTLARSLLSSSGKDAAVEIVQTLKETPEFDQVAEEFSIDLANESAIEAAARLAKEMKNLVRRVLVFHEIARIQAKRMDLYGKLGTAPKGEEGASPSSIQGKAYNERDIQKMDEALVDLIKKSDSRLIAMDIKDSDLGKTIPELETEKLGVNYREVKDRIPALTPARVHAMLYNQTVFNIKFVDAAGVSGFVNAQNTHLPQIIFIEQGVVDIPTIYDAMMAQGHKDFIQKDGRIYTFRKPLVVGPKAELVISGADVDEMRLSEEAQTYIANAGKLYVADTKIVGWSEEQNKRSYRTSEEFNSYRPFVTSWSESKTYLTTSLFSSLGYANSKSYGITLSSGPLDYIRYRYTRLARPEAVITDCSFENLLYGFYSYEADNVVLVGNEYIDNTIYGIDPHDRSRWFTIAYNTAYDTQKKHGIIISREVNDSTILGNVLFDNHGSGIMADRQSSGTLIYANTSFDNDLDGLTIYESSCKVIASNQFFDNHRSGIKIRNSIDIGIYFNTIRNNVGAGVQGYIADLRKLESQKLRDFELDPYSDVTAASLVNNLIEHNGTGIYADTLSALFLRGNEFVDQSPRLFRGNWAKDLPKLVAWHDIDSKSVLITERCPEGEMILSPCKFRDDGIFNGDGQNNLQLRVHNKICRTAVPEGPK